MNSPNLFVEPVNKKAALGQSSLHCEICDLALTSTQNAKQHYLGRKHRNAMAGTSNPAGSGYYDKETGKWIRTLVTIFYLLYYTFFLNIYLL